MTPQTILKKAIEKAVGNGYDLPSTNGPQKRSYQIPRAVSLTIEA